MKKLLPLIGGGVGALVGFGLLFVWLFGGGIDTPNQLIIAMRLLDKGEWKTAGGIAVKLEEQGRIDQETNSAWHYVQGLSTLKAIGNNLDSPSNRRELATATEHFTKAHELGFPIGYKGKGQFYLGRCFFNTYRFDDVTTILQDSEKLWPERRSDAFRMQVSSYLQKAPPEFTEANDRLIAWSAIPGLNSSEMGQFSLARAHYAFAEKRYADCEKEAMAIPVDTPERDEGAIWRGRWRLERAAELRLDSAERERILAEASQIIQKVQFAPATPPRLSRQTSFLAGRILRMQDKIEEALGAFSSVRHSAPQSAEAIASSLEEAEILLDAGRIEDAVATCQLLLRNIEDLTLYNGYWLPVSQLRTRLLAIGRTLGNDRMFDQVVRLASHIALAFPPSDSVRLKADAYLQWADDLLVNPTDDPNLTPTESRKQSNEKYAAAAEQFELLAELEVKSTEYPDILWSAINTHRAANDLESANRILHTYLYHEEKPKRPRGFLALARNFVDAAQWSEAIPPLERCIDEYPGHSILYEARLLASKAHTEMGQLDEAAELLEENLFVHNLEPRSETWRDSMYNLGLTRAKQGKRLLLDADKLIRDGNNTAEILEKYEQSQQRLTDSIRHLGHASTRYVGEPRFFEAQYMIAVADRLAAQTYKSLAEENDAIIESKRRQMMAEWRRRLDDTLQQYQSLREEVSRNQEIFESNEQFNALVRNCMFGEADSLFDLERWEEASNAYRRVAGRYMKGPESLEALVQLAECYRKLNQPEDAIKSLTQAEQVLARIPDEMNAQFVSLTRTDRAGWQKLLPWLKQWN